MKHSKIFLETKPFRDRFFARIGITNYQFNGLPSDKKYAIHLQWIKSQEFSEMKAKVKQSN